MAPKTPASKKRKLSESFEVLAGHAVPSTSGHAEPSTSGHAVESKTGDGEEPAGPSKKQKSLRKQKSPGSCGDEAGEPGHAEPSTSGHAVESKTGDGEEPAVKNIPRHTAREVFFQQYRDMKIEVNNSVHISRVWYFKRDVPADPLKYYDVVSRDYPLEQYQHWDGLISFACPNLLSENEEIFNIIYKIFQKMSVCLTFIGTKWICDKAKEKEYDDFMNQLMCDDRYFMLPIIYAQGGSLFESLKAGMTNGIGRDGIRSIISLAFLPWIRNLGKNSVILNVGTSRAKEESFPVEVVSHARETGMVDYYFRSMKSQSSGDLENGSHDPGSDVGKAEIYADVLVLTVKEMWACCTFVVEIKSEPLGARCIGQLLSQMLAVLLHQRFCFGLLINASEAYMYSMEWNKDETRINCSRKYYHFVVLRYVNGKHVYQFCAATMTLLFNDIVAILQHSRINLTKCMQKY